MRLAAIALLAGLLALPQAVLSETGLALVYRGPGACEGCPEAAAEVARSIGLTVTYIGPDQITAARLRSARVYVQPGGPDSLDLARALGAQGMRALADYVRQGGRYWGLCAGGYLAGAWLDDDATVPGLRLYDGDASVYSPHAARTEMVTWHGAARRMYLQEAPAFELSDAGAAGIIGRYRSGEIAAFQAASGQGWIALTGPHPEATQDWLADDGLTAPDLAPADLARQMLQDLLRAGSGD